MKNLQDLIDDLGGPVATACQLGLCPSTVRSWYSGKSKPYRRHMQDLLNAHENRRFTINLDDLLKKALTKAGSKYRLSVELGRNATVVRDWYSGKRTPSYTSVLSLAKYVEE